MRHFPLPALAIPPAAVGVATVALAAVAFAAALVLAGARTTLADRPDISRAARADRPAQAATPSPDPRPNLVADRGHWKLKGRNIGIGNRCVTGNGYDQGFHICIANHGSAPSGPFVVTADGAPSVPVLSTGGLEPNETLCAPVDVAPGVGLFIDAGDTVAESDENDNWQPPVPVPTLAPIAHPTCVPHATPMAELTGTGWSGFVDTQGFGCWPTHLPTKYLDGARVANDGEVAAGPFRIGPPGWTIHDLPADADRTVDHHRVASSFSSEIDPDNDVPEHSETNNTIHFLRATAPPTCTADATVTPSPTPTPIGTPGPPDLTATITLNIGRCDNDGALFGPYHYRPCIVNQGGTEARGFVARFGEGAEAEDVAVPQLDAGGRLCLAERALVSTVIDIDPDNRVAESDETNNRVPVHIPPELPPPACTPGPAPTATPTPITLPNLRGWARWWIDLPEGCIPTDRPVPPFYSEITVQNVGGAAAGPFDTVAEPPGAQRWAFEALSAGASYSRGPSLLTFYRAVIDPDNRVVESDESDNDIYVPVPTMPPYCPTATQTPGDGSPTPVRTVTPSLTPSVVPGRRLFVPLVVRTDRLAGR